MRLTLRTLLAYMDEILEPADRAELAKKVESSEFAHDLIHRTKDTMRRLRLSAPQVLGSGIGLDPNTVAEYLDNVLPPDSVADFERICLESDVHLAEVASAHHVLTMVLGEPAEVDPVARQRMYAIPAEAEEHKRQAVAPQLAPPTVQPSVEYIAAAAAPPPSVYPAASFAPVVTTRTAGVPDYLRANSWTRHRMLLGACAAVLVAIVGFLLTSGMGSWFGGPPQMAGGPVNAIADTSQSAVNDTQSLPSVPQADADDAPAVSIASESVAAPTSMPAVPPRLPVPPLGVSPPSTTAADESANAEQPAEVLVDESAYGYESAGTRSTDEDEPADRYADKNEETPPAGSIASIPMVVPPATTSVEVAQPETGRDDAAVAKVPPAEMIASGTSVPITEPASDLTADIAAEASTPTPPTELGTYLDGKNVLARFNTAAGAWFRMTPRSTIHPGDKLLALPAFYPQLTLASGLHLKLAGGTLISIDSAADNSSTPVIDVAYGKLVVVNTTNGENQLQLKVGSETASVRLGLGATLAIDAEPKYSPGKDPRESPAPLAVEVYVREGDVVWDDAAGSRTIAAPAQWGIAGGEATVVATDGKFPEWIDEEPVEQRSEKLFGAPAVDAALDPTRPVGEQLLELYQSSSRREVKSLVARSGVYAGLFVPFVEALRDSDQKGSWRMHIDTLRSAMSLGPDSAKNIYQTLVDQRGKPAADDLYQMLCGYGPEQVGTPEAFRDGLAVKLVDWMEEDSLDYRVLAVQDMDDVTGKRLMPNPAGSPTERARGIRLWRQRLKAGEVAPLTP